jgi:hypothetical protein
MLPPVRGTPTRRGDLVMKRTISTLLAGLATIALGAGTASATTGGCLLPQFACEEFYDDFTGSVDPASDQKTYEKQCREFRDACLKVCKQTKECVEVALTGVVRGWSLECNDLEGAERADCKQSVSQDIKSFEELLSESRAECRDCCDAYYIDCLESSH